MKTIALNREKIYSGNLLLVNAAYPLKNTMKKDLIPADMHFPNILMKRDAVNVLQLILEKISANGAIVPVSGYRSAEDQTTIQYIEFIKSYPDSYRYPHKQGYETEAEVYFVPADTDGISIILIPSQAVYQISGNNIDGFIITVWRRTNEHKKELSRN